MPCMAEKMYLYDHTMTVVSNTKRDANAYAPVSPEDRVLVMFTADGSVLLAAAASPASLGETRVGSCQEKT